MEKSPKLRLETVNKESWHKKLVEVQKKWTFPTLQPEQWTPSLFWENKKTAKGLM